MFDRRCLFLLVLLLLPNALAQIDNSPVCNLIPLESKIDVLIQQNSNLREQLANAFDQNHYDQLIGDIVNKKMDAKGKDLDALITIDFVGLAMVVIGIMTVMYWFVLTKLKKAVNANAGR